MLTRAQAEAPPEVIDLMAVDQVDVMSEKLPPHIITSMKHLFDKLYAKITPQVEDHQMEESAPASAAISARASIRGSATPAPASVRGSVTPVPVASVRGSARNSATPAPSVAPVQAEAAVEPENVIQKDASPELVEEAPIEDAIVEDAIIEETMADAAPVETSQAEASPIEPPPVKVASVEAEPVKCVVHTPAEVQAEASPVRETTPAAAVPVQVVTETEPEPEKMDEDLVENHVEPQLQQQDDDDTEMLL
jgi:hypothetical protein